MARLKVFGLFLCEPADKFLSVGITSGLEKIIDEKIARQRGYRIIKRYTGGGAVLLGPGQIFYELVLPRSEVCFKVERATRELSLPVAEFYRSLGLDARVEGLDITVGGRKISGQGAGDIDGAFVFVGNVLMRFDPSEFAEVIKTRRKQELSEELYRNITWLEREGIFLKPEEVFKMLIEEFKKVLPLGEVSELPEEVFKLTRQVEIELEEDWEEDRPIGEIKLREGVMFKLN